MRHDNINYKPRRLLSKKCGNLQDRFRGAPGCASCMLWCCTFSVSLLDRGLLPRTADGWDWKLYWGGGWNCWLLKAFCGANEDWKLNAIFLDGTSGATTNGGRASRERYDKFRVHLASITITHKPPPFLLLLRFPFVPQEGFRDVYEIGTCLLNV
jgi:hypothetical protein